MIDPKEIVLLDDNDDTNFYNKDVVEETNLFSKISVYDNPIELLEALKDRIHDEEPIPGCFLVDIRMPQMDGYEFIDELDTLVEDFPTPPTVFMLTTSQHKVDREQFDRSELAKRYLVKPLLPEILEQAIDAINNPSASRDVIGPKY